jgi:hypothetical protein
MPRRVPLALAAAALTAAATPGHAYRPLVLEEADTVAPGRVLAEGEVAVADEAGGGRTQPLARRGGDTLGARVWLIRGWTDRIDLRLSAGYLAVDPAAGDAEHGPADTGVGARLRLREGEGRGDPSLALEPTLVVPTADADRGLGTGSLDVRLVGVGSWRLRRDGRLDLNVGYTFVGRDTLDGARLRDPLLYGAALEWALRDGPRLAAEVFRAESVFRGERAETTGTLGLVWGARRGLEFGAGVRRRIGSGAGPDWAVIVGAGLARR